MLLLATILQRGCDKSYHYNTAVIQHHLPDADPFGCTTSIHDSHQGHSPQCPSHRGALGLPGLVAQDDFPSIGLELTGDLVLCQ